MTVSLDEMFKGSGDKEGISRAIIVLELLDMSGSMKPNQQAVIDALNSRRKALEASPDASYLRMSMWTFNGMISVLHDFQAIEKIPVIDDKKYQPDGMTALYDVIRDGFKAAKAFRDELRAKRVKTRMVIVVYSDGEDTASQYSKAADVAKEAAELLHEDTKCTLVFFGFGDDAKSIPAQIGFPEKNALYLGHDERDIRHAIEVDTPILLNQPAN